MSKFFSKKHSSLVPYTPGEQPKDMKYIKLNTNESPYPPSPLAQKYSAEAAKNLELYPDPECHELHCKIAELLGVSPSEVLATNGSDEILNFAFQAFCDDENTAVFADITYGFYKVFAQINHIPYKEIPLSDDFTINIDDYIGINKNIFIANPNAPTGIILPKSDIEKIISSNPNNIVVVDEAYIDFGGESCVDLIHKYDNLIVTQTFSKSRSMAGARLGFGVACESLIRDMNTIKYSTNPYNINRMTMAAGIGSLIDDEYTKNNCQKIQDVRNNTTESLNHLGFDVLDSSANFVFAKHKSISGETIYNKLRENGILVRHFTAERICEYNRITIGTEEQMKKFIDVIKNII